MKLDAWRGPSTDDLATGDDYDAEALRQYDEQGPLFSWFEDTGGYTYAHENPRAWALLSPAEVDKLSRLVAIAKYSDDQARGPDGRWVSGGGVSVATDGETSARDYSPDRSTAVWKDAVAEIRDQGTGNCFGAAVTFGMNHDALGFKNFRIVQATVAGTGELDGIRFVHTWVEADSQVLEVQGKEMVFRDAFDFSSGLSAQMPESLYRHFGQAENVHEYTWDEAVIQMLETGVDGPWAEDLVEVYNWEAGQGLH